MLHAAIELAASSTTAEAEQSAPCRDGSTRLGEATAGAGSWVTPSLYSKQGLLAALELWRKLREQAVQLFPNTLIWSPLN